MGSKSAARRKHAQTVKEQGRALADEKGAVRQESSRRRVRSAHLDVWYGVILGAMGPVCACDGQQGRSGICKRVVAVSETLDRMWNLAKNAKRRRRRLRMPETRCRNTKCRSKNFTRYGKYPKDSGKTQRYKCKKCGKTFSGTPGFKGRHFSPAVIRRALNDHVSGKSLQEVVRGLGLDNIGVSRTTIHRWSREHSALVDKFSRGLRPTVGPKWHCDEMFHKILGKDRWLFAVIDGATRYILARDESDTKSGYKPLPLFLAARKLAGLDPWIFVTDGLAAFAKAAPKAFRRREGFRLLHIRDIHLRNIFNTNNIYERLNGEFKARIKTARGFSLKPNKKTDGNLGGGCPAMMRLLIVHHNFFRPHSALNGKTPAEAAGIIMHGDDKWATMIANAAQA